MSMAHAPNAWTRGWRGFGRWRRSRPFWGGLLLLVAGLELFLSSNQSIAGIQFHTGIEGLLSYLLPVLLLLAAVLTWVTPGQRIFYGVVGAGTAVYSLIGLNLGGWFLGALLGMIGGALLIAWAPNKPVAADALAQSDVADVAGPPDAAGERAAMPSESDDAAESVWTSA